MLQVCRLPCSVDHVAPHDQQMGYKSGSHPRLWPFIYYLYINVRDHCRLPVGGGSCSLCVMLMSIIIVIGDEEHYSNDLRERERETLPPRWVERESTSVHLEGESSG